MRGGWNVLRMSLAGGIVYLTLLATGIAEMPSVISSMGNGKPTLARPTMTAVRRADLEVRTTTAGRVNSSEETTSARRT